MKEDRQLELEAKPLGSHHRRKVSRANWWFQQMRESVDKAIDWQPEKRVELARPETPA